MVALALYIRQSIAQRSKLIETKKFKNFILKAEKCIFIIGNIYRTVLFFRTVVLYRTGFWFFFQIRYGCLIERIKDNIKLICTNEKVRL